MAITISTSVMPEDIGIGGCIGIGGIGGCIGKLAPELAFLFLFLANGLRIPPL